MKLLLEKRHHDGTIYDQFRYDVVRIWEQPAERFLTAGLAVLPLAPVADVRPERLAEVLTAVARRLKQEASAEQTETLWKATTILLSLRYTKAQVEDIIREVAIMSLGIRGIEESWLYQESFQKGIAEGSQKQACNDLLLVGQAKFGPADEATVAAIAAIHDMDRLHTLLTRVVTASSWEELLL